MDMHTLIHLDNILRINIVKDNSKVRITIKKKM